MNTKEGTQKTGRRPDYVLSVKVKDQVLRRRLGVAWANDDGSISIALDPCTVISWTDNVHVSLFPNEER